MCIHIGTSGWSYDHWRGVLYGRFAGVPAPYVLRPALPNGGGNAVRNAETLKAILHV